MYGVSACFQHQQRNASVIIIRVNAQTNLKETFSKEYSLFSLPIESVVRNMSNFLKEVRCSYLNTLLQVSAECVEYVLTVKQDCEKTFIISFRLSENFVLDKCENR